MFLSLSLPTSSLGPLDLSIRHLLQVPQPRMSPRFSGNSVHRGNCSLGPAGPSPSFLLPWHHASSLPNPLLHLLSWLGLETGWSLFKFTAIAALPAGRPAALPSLPTHIAQLLSSPRSSVR
uniref:Uncharacterized protein n=1 Tax=Myotis myotis TaxID=51298 RepID=A0A7J7RUL1_MYOMY|nr:hypothetical protein mMyoMyo1_010131 [Myotis myotis]